MTPEKIKEEVLKKIEEEYGIMAADSITAEAIDLALRKQAEAIKQDLLKKTDKTVLTAEDIYYYFRKWCKKC